MSESRICLIACDDEVGLVAKVTGILFHRGLNIVSNWEYVDHASQRFFMRTEIEGTFEDNDLVKDITAALPGGAMVRLALNRPRRLVVMATREPHCLGDLLIRCAFRTLNAEILAVVGNHDILKPLTEQFGHPFHTVSHEGRSREEHEADVLEVLERYHPDFVILAKYMRILTPAFVERYRHRLINIHHSFLPAFIGANPYRQAYERGVKIIGATAHFVNDTLDEGPIIAQNTVPIGHHHTPKDLAAAGRNVETMVLARALDLVFNERVFVCGNRTIVFD